MLDVSLLTDLIENPNYSEVVSSLIFCLPDPYLSVFNHILSSRLGSSYDKVNLGAQNVSSCNPLNGSFTGETTAAMLSDIGCKYVIVGHSERRVFFKECSGAIIKKLSEALKYNLRPILCVGDTKDQRDAGSHVDMVLQQINDVSDVLSLHKDIIIAYEPVWAIGTGFSPSVSDVSSLVKTIKNHCFSNFGRYFNVLYGGSVNSVNINSFLSSDSLDGVLVGGSSFPLKNFFDMCCFLKLEKVNV